VFEESPEQQAASKHRSQFVYARLSTGQTLPVGCMVWSVSADDHCD
jgi:hypothetical protein